MKRFTTKDDAEKYADTQRETISPREYMKIDYVEQFGFSCYAIGIYSRMGAFLAYI